MYKYVSYLLVTRAWALTGMDLSDLPHYPRIMLAARDDQSSY